MDFEFDSTCDNRIFKYCLGWKVSMSPLLTVIQRYNMTLGVKDPDDSTLKTLSVRFTCI